MTHCFKMENYRMLVVPDVHGRIFWRDEVYNVLKSTSDVKVIFLGDYVDPYVYEYISNDDAFCVLEEIIELKKEYGDRVILLLGNHDFHYFNGSTRGPRKDYERCSDLKHLYMDNMDIFEYYHIEQVGDTKYLFSHAGFLKSWLISNAKELGISDIIGQSDDISVDLISNIDFKVLFSDKKVRSCMNSVSCWSGGYEIDSFMWADIREHFGVDEKISECVQVCGHTQQQKDYVKINNVYCLDCRDVFYIFDDGIKMHVESEFVLI